MIKRALILSAAFLLFFSIAFAAVGIQKDGVQESAATDLDFRGNVVLSGDAAKTVQIGGAYEISTTGDTLVAADSGKTLITNLKDADGIVDFVLPAATTAGIVYKFVTGERSIIRIDPAAATATDQILYASLSQGDRIGSGTAASADGASGDSITLMSTGTGWAVTEMNPDDGSWADAN